MAWCLVKHRNNFTFFTFYIFPGNRPAFQCILSHKFLDSVGIEDFCLTLKHFSLLISMSIAHTRRIFVSAESSVISDTFMYLLT
jgi:hypothetical protein